MNNCQFKQFEDLKNIPGLPVTYYERFMKVSYIGKSKLCVVIRHHVSGLGDNAEVDLRTGWRGAVSFTVRLLLFYSRYQVGGLQKQPGHDGSKKMGIEPQLCSQYTELSQ